MAEMSGESGPLIYSDNDHSSALLEKLKYQRESGQFCDVLLRVQGKFFHAHRSVLAGCSPYFYSVLKKHKTTHEQLTVNCENHEIFGLLLSYMYEGQIIINKDNVDELLRLSDQLNLDKLKSYCNNYLGTNLTLLNCFKVKALAVKYTLEILDHITNTFITDNMEQLLLKPEIFGLNYESFNLILNNTGLDFNQITILRLISKWVSVEPERKYNLRSLLNGVKFNELEPDSIWTHLKQEPIYDKDELKLTFLQVLKDKEHNLGMFQDVLNVLESTTKPIEDRVETPKEEEIVEHSVEETAEPQARARTRKGNPVKFVPTEEYIEEMISKSMPGESPADLGVESKRKKLNPPPYITTIIPKEDPDATSDKTDSEDTSDDDYDSSTASGNKTVTKPYKGSVKCPHCSYVEHSATRLERHIERVHTKEIIYMCSLCEFSCNWNREFYAHMKVHFTGPPFNCETCSYTSDRLQVLLKHRMRHTDARPFKCDQCTYTSRTESNLQIHLRCHTGEKPYQCDQCGNRFAMKSGLDQHIQSHRTDRPFNCEICNFSCKYKSYLVSHMRIHTGTAFRCDYQDCQFLAPKKSQLNAHMKTHKGIRTHFCTVCERGFVERSHLVRHERIHLKEKPFKCQSCDYSSNRNDKLKEHVDKHHNPFV